ncbi:neutral ceramidase-like isoform X1 [Dinothrombium tinctorium]|uniref:Neutral ceramidase-like isoform X1 n=1 Tax=Dinothrombium tinctorium TaxID=1965070 RepID=A0A443QNA8_9ACAR|nr:neutral ceramidase-like isoform X1 [Dinothrombium tinctorium]
MAGRRLRAALKQILQTNHVIWASTTYGPYTLNAYIQQFVKLAKAMLNGTTLNAGPQPAYRKPLKAQSQFAFDIAEYNFGTVKFAAGNPANNLMTQKTFLAVQRLNEAFNWQTIATDDNPETKITWSINVAMGLSEAIIEWKITNDTAPGIYKIVHYCQFKKGFTESYHYSGETRAFTVVPS